MPVTFSNSGFDKKLLTGKRREIAAWINKVIESENNIPGNITIIFTGRKELLKLNKSFLRHNYHTDIITFDFNRGNVINGDLYIGAEQVKLNSAVYKVSFTLELLRVIIHGIFHLLGYSDCTEETREKMRRKENAALKEIHF